MPVFFPIAPPPAYIESAHGLRAMSAEYEQWCLPAAEVPAEFRPDGRDPICQLAARPSVTPYTACVAQLFPQPEVIARPGERVRFHVAAEVGTGTVTIAQGDSLGILGPVTEWTATGVEPAGVGISATGPRGSVTYGAWVVVTRDVRPPQARVNVRPGRRLLEIGLTRRADVAVCFDTPDRRSVGPSRFGMRPRGMTRLALPSTLPRAVTIRLESPTGVPKRITLRVRT